MKKHPLVSLTIPNYRLFLIGSSTSQIGVEIQTVALTWQLYLLTHSPLSLGFIGLARAIPLFIFSLLGGVLADVVDRRKLLILAQALMALFSLLFALSSLTNHTSTIIIYMLIAVISAIDSFHIPARQSITPALVPKSYFANAVSIGSTLWQLTRIIGPAIAGYLLATISPAYIYFIVTALFAIAMITRIMLTLPEQKWEKTPTFDVQSFMEGIHFVRRSPLIWSTMVLDFIATFFSSATTLLPIYAKDILKVGPQGLGMLYSAASIGSVIAGLFISALTHIKNQGKILFAAVFIYGAATTLFAISNSFYLSILLLALTGIGDMISAVIRSTIRQLITPDHLRGRMVSVNMLFFLGGPQLGEVEAGLLAAAVGTPLSVVIGGIGTMVGTVIIAYLVPKLWNYHNIETHENN